MSKSFLTDYALRVIDRAVEEHKPSKAFALQVGYQVEVAGGGKWKNEKQDMALCTSCVIRDAHTHG